MPFLESQPTSKQLFYYSDYKITIERPEIGSKLYRINKKTKDSNIYVVTKVFTRINGKNTNIVDKIFLHLMIEDLRGEISYDEKEKIILHLNNHGQWWNQKISKEYKHSWNKPPSRVSSIHETVNKLIKPIHRRLRNKPIK